MEYVSRLIAKLEPFLNHLSYQGVNMIIHDCSLMRFRFDLHRTELRGVTYSVNLMIGKAAMLIQVKRNKNRLKLIQNQTILIFLVKRFLRKLLSVWELFTVSFPSFVCHFVIVPFRKARKLSLNSLINMKFLFL